MKKSNLMVGICYLLVGIISLLLALFTETKLDGLFFGFTGAGIVPGLMMIYKPEIFMRLNKNCAKTLFYRALRIFMFSPIRCFIHKCDSCIILVSKQN